VRLPATLGAGVAFQRLHEEQRLERGLPDLDGLPITIDKAIEAA
jgi:hypothetical protein